MARLKRILIWGREDVLSTSIEFVLAANKEWNVITIFSKEDCAALAQATEATEPDTVIARKESLDDSAAAAFCLLQSHPAIKVIIVSLEDNVVDVYCKESIVMRGAPDLLAAISNEPASLAQALQRWAEEYYLAADQSGKEVWSSRE